MASGWHVYTPPPPTVDGWSRAPRGASRPPRHGHRQIPKPPVRPPHRTFTDPFAPSSDAQLRARAASETQGALGPLLAQIQQAIEARSRSGMAAIGGLTGELGHLWQGVAPATAGIYG